MRFRELRIEASAAVSDHGVVAPDLHFRWTTHHLREIFVAQLPRDFTLDGSSVVQITCGPRGSEPKYRRVLGSTEYFVENFDFASYASASPTERELLLLKVVEDGLGDIARRVGANSAIIAKAAQGVRDCNFELATEIKKLKKRIPGTARTIRVFRSLSSAQGEVWRLHVRARDGTVLEEVVMGKVPNYLDRRDFYHVAHVDGTEYVVKENHGRESFRFDFSHLV